MSASTLYDEDFCAWANEQAALLRAGKIGTADIDHIAEEIESMGRTEKRELISRMATLLAHLLKWEFQSARQTKSWRLTIEEQRRAVIRHMRDNPSLKPILPEVIQDAYGDAMIAAERETDLDRAAFPAACPWTYPQITDADFWPPGE